MFSTPQLLAFERRLVQVDQLNLVKSTCIECGAKIIGSVADRLQEDEAEHLADCYGSARKQSAVIDDGSG